MPCHLCDDRQRAPPSKWETQISLGAHGDSGPSFTVWLSGAQDTEGLFCFCSGQGWKPALTGRAFAPAEPLQCSCFPPLAPACSDSMSSPQSGHQPAPPPHPGATVDTCWVPGGLSKERTFPVLATQDKAHCTGHRLPSQAPCGQLAFFFERLLCASQSQHFGGNPHPPVWLEM